MLLSVGHTERFNPVVRAMQRLEVRPKYIETQRVSPFRFRSADVGVVADMMIHDIDIVLHMVRSRVVHVDAVGVSVLGRHEDVANARVAFENGAVANLVASRLALKTDRRIRVFSEMAYLSATTKARAASPSRATQIWTSWPWRKTRTSKISRRWRVSTSARW